jgi:hypothetical protein
MNARSHTALRVAAFVWIAVMALLPREIWAGVWGESNSVAASTLHGAAVEANRSPPLARR